ncbi:FadR/GntR family transcriptional regulator [uncultured Amnibacterium sp.]|uniref:FadR/GntR family transcriptional regulator n=1 Tax=uncultured Amnibacterium sp. TaxID=1631851 RepID=UPI0035CB7FE5
MSGSGRPGALLAPIEASTRVDGVTDRLVTAIAVGEYLPGTRLPPERDLAAALSVGRMTVRAALARLVDRGLIETQRGRHGGSFVLEQWPASSDAAVRRTLELRWEGLRDRAEAVARLHGAVCRAAAEARTAEDAATLAERLEGYRSAASGLESQLADSRLHLATMDAAHNATLKQVLQALEGGLSIGAPTHLWGAPDGRRAMELRALAEHETLVAAIVDGRADDAESLARAHVGIDLELLESARARAGLA